MATTNLVPVDTLGTFLRERRERLAAPEGERRRRTPGLRREEVAARAGVSVTWYTWLEQGRGGPPSAELLERLAGALELDPAGRELLFLLGQGRPPPVVPAPLPTVPAALQRVLDALSNPAIVKSPTWDVVAWNAASTRLMTDWSALPRAERNLMRRMFGMPDLKALLPDWEENARFTVAVFRIDVARAGGSDEADALVAELSASSPDFRRLWADVEVRNHGVGRKRIAHPQAGMIGLEYMAFPVDGAEGLTMIVFSPASPEDARRIDAVQAGAPQ